jgi:hypothetical protein
MTSLSDLAWSCYEQGAVIASLLIAIALVAVAFKRSELKLNSPFVVSLSWDFSRSWASNITGLAGVIGISVANSITTDFKPFTHVSIKNSYTVTAVLMAAIVIAAPSVYNLLQVRENGGLAGCVGGFLAASVLTIWGTIAQLVLQVALLVAFVNEQVSYRFGLILVPAILVFGLSILFPYSIRSIQVALANETQQPPVPAKATAGVSAPDKSQAGAEPTVPAATVAAGAPRRLALL